MALRPSLTRGLPLSMFPGRTLIDFSAQVNGYGHLSETPTNLQPRCNRRTSSVNSQFIVVHAGLTFGTQARHDVSPWARVPTGATGDNAFATRSNHGIGGAGPYGARRGREFRSESPAVYNRAARLLAAGAYVVVDELWDVAGVVEAMILADPILMPYRHPNEKEDTEGLSSG